MPKYKTFKKEKWVFLILSVFIYFVPFIVVTACLFPLMNKADAGYRWALGIVLVLMRVVPFILRSLHSAVAHCPMLDLTSLVLFLVALSFRFDIFADYQDKFLIILGVSVASSIISTVFWFLYKKYAAYHTSIKAAKKSGMFVVEKEESNAQS
ncbi:MAG: hypothetical protein ACI4MN_06070 [Candidatus Coproplasma sp.]